MNPFYKDYSEYMSEIFPGLKVQKISLNAGFSCPNRDGSIGRGGCSYCNNASFTPSYCVPSDDVATQLAKGKAFFARKYPEMQFLAYFQSYTNTHGRSAADLRRLWLSALEEPDVVGLSVATRPDCLPQQVVGVLAELATEKPVFLELGAESACDATLERVCRRHTWADVEDAAVRAAAAGLRVGLHLIAGLPGESRADVLRSVDVSCVLPIDSLKLHHLQVISGTPMAAQWQAGDFRLLFPTPEAYMELCAEVVDHVPRSICIERFLTSSPPEMVLAPKWGQKNHEFVNSLHNLLRRRNV